MKTLTTATVSQRSTGKITETNLPVSFRRGWHLQDEKLGKQLSINVGIEKGHHILFRLDTETLVEALFHCTTGEDDDVKLRKISAAVGDYLEKKARAEIDTKLKTALRAAGGAL